MAWAKAEPKLAQAYQLGSGFSFAKLRPRKAKPSPWLSGQAEPAHHYIEKPFKFEFKFVSNN